MPDRIPYDRKLDPRMEEPVIAVCSKQGMRILVSRDDGKSWVQTFLGTESLEDGGWHGTFAVYGMASTRGVIGVFSGWGAPGVYIGSDDGVHWGHFNAKSVAVRSVWSATGGNGILLTSADQWRGISSARGGMQEWTSHPVKQLLNGGKTHHMICGFGDFDGGRFVVVGDNRHVFIGNGDLSEWKHSRIPELAGDKQSHITFGNGVFVCSFEQHVARSEDGGQTWTVHPHGLSGRGPSWRGLSFVNGEFWLTGRRGSRGRRSRDGIRWEDLPESTPSGRFVVTGTGAIVNVDRGRFTIQRSQDGVKWSTVFKAPAQDVSWDLSFLVTEKLNKVAPD